MCRSKRRPTYLENLLCGYTGYEAIKWANLSKFNNKWNANWLGIFRNLSHDILYSRRVATFRICMVVGALITAYNQVFAAEHYS